MAVFSLLCTPVQHKCIGQFESSASGCLCVSTSMVEFTAGEKMSLGFVANYRFECSMHAFFQVLSRIPVSFDCK